MVETNGSAYDKAGFCATIVDKSTTKRIGSDDVSDFASVASEGYISWIDFAVKDMDADCEKVAISLGFSESLVKSLMKNPISGYEDFGSEMGVMVPAILVKGFDVTHAKLLILIKQNLILTLHGAQAKRFIRMRKYAETYMRKLPLKIGSNDKITLVLIRILDENNGRNFDHLQEIEEVGDNLSLQLADPKAPREKIAIEIHNMKHALIIYLKGMWAIIDALNSLRYGDAELLTDDSKILERLSALVNEVNVHIGLTEHMSEVLASGLEVVQSIYNNQLQILNNRLAMLVAVLTIVGTGLLVPNTIATVVSGPMFEFTPKDLAWYLPLLAVSTVAATALSWIAMDRLGFLPKSPE